MRFARIAIILALATPLNAAAAVVQSEAHVSVHIPDSFRPVAQGSGPGIPPVSGISSVKQFVDDAKGITISIINLPVSSTREALAELPSSSGQVPPSFTDASLGGLLKPGPGKPVRDNARVIPLLFDNDRKAIGFEAQSTMMPLAKVLLAEGDSSPDWQRVKQSGADPRLGRCLLSTIVEGYSHGIDPIPKAAIACSTPEDAVTAYVNAMTPDYFKLRRVIERFMEVVTAKGLTIVKVDGEEHARAAVEDTWRDIWDRTAPNADAVIHRGIANRLALLNYSVPGIVTIALDGLVGAFLWGILFSSLFIRLGAGPTIATISAQAGFCGLSFLVDHESLSDGSVTGSGLILIISSILMFPVVLRRAKKRTASERLQRLRTSSH